MYFTDLFKSTVLRFKGKNERMMEQRKKDEMESLNEKKNRLTAINRAYQIGDDRLPEGETIESDQPRLRLVKNAEYVIPTKDDLVKSLENDGKITSALLLKNWDEVDGEAYKKYEDLIKNEERQIFNNKTMTLPDITITAPVNVMKDEQAEITEKKCKKYHVMDCKFNVLPGAIDEENFKTTDPSHYILAMDKVDNDHPLNANHPEWKNVKEVIDKNDDIPMSSPYDSSHSNDLLDNVNIVKEEKEEKKDGMEPNRINRSLFFY